MKKALVGYGGHAREVQAQMGTKLTCFVDDDYVVEGTEPLSKFNPEEYALMVAVADSRSRHNILQRLPKETQYFTFIHPTVLIMDTSVEIGEGSFIGAYSIITTNIKINKHALLNRANHIGHDTVLGNCFSAMPGAIVSGNCIVGDGVYVGTNASIREKIAICDSVVVGMNSCVVKDIKQPGVYVGNPAVKVK
jgi:sugar O-acyltransferase (sialic acid O-acetyltransferase NeuD family)